eukprot:4489622-Pyramimonas_sp.AAC.1
MRFPHSVPLKRFQKLLGGCLVCSFHVEGGGSPCIHPPFTRNSPLPGSAWIYWQSGRCHPEMSQDFVRAQGGIALSKRPRDGPRATPNAPRGTSTATWNIQEHQEGFKRTPWGSKVPVPVDVPSAFEGRS